MKSLRIILFPLFCAFFLAGTVQGQDNATAGPGSAAPGPGPGSAQQEWPKSFTMDDGSVVKIYQPQPESFSDNILKSRWAISVLQPGKQDPIFGTFWSVANVETDRDNRQVLIQSAKVPNIKFQGQTDDNLANTMKTALEANLPQTAGSIPLDELLSSLDESQEQKKLSKDLNTNAPRIIYADQSSILVMIDGEPKLQPNKDWGVDVVQNTPFTIVKNTDGNFYLYGGKHWYTAQAATGPYSPAGNIPSNLQQVQNAVDQANSSNAGYEDSASAVQDNNYSRVIVSTSPAELIQSTGAPTFSPISGTDLSYVSNSPNDIFQDQSSGKYYVLISGRWYTSSSLNGGWHYIAANTLPANFARIPEGSPKDNVLASVAGTDAAREAVMDAQIPQTAKVDRSTATASVNYNGDPQFQPIQGTNMQYATNTSSSVIEDNGVYYVVDNGVWFTAPSPSGPWTVATQRPGDVDQIPPSSPLYNTKYVYVYDVTPQYVYMGYTPGYLNAYIYGPTVVYGTGFYYNPWYGGYYYPRPWTWGFGMGYNPWYGWGLGYGFGYGGWFHFGVGFGGGWGHWGGGGWWGPHVYHPPYAWGGFRGRGFYGPNAYRGRVGFGASYHGNVYNGRAGIITNRTVINNRTTINNNGFRGQNGANRPFSSPGNTGNRVGPQGQTARPQNNVTSDRNGNVYQRNANTNQWQQRQSNSWRPVANNSQSAQNLNRQQQMVNRGQQRTQNFQAARSGGGSAPRTSNSGGGSRSSSGGSRRR